MKFNLRKASDYFNETKKEIDIFDLDDLITFKDTFENDIIISKTTYKEMYGEHDYTIMIYDEFIE